MLSDKFGFFPPLFIKCYCKEFDLTKKGLKKKKKKADNVCVLTPLNPFE